MRNRTVFFVDNNKCHVHRAFDCDLLLMVVVMLQSLINWRSVSRRSALESFSQSSHSEERGAVRFLLWWLFPPPITLRQRSSTFAEPLCSLWRVLASGCQSFLSAWLEKVSQPSLAEPFDSDQGVVRINSRLSHLSLGRHRTDCRSLCQSRDDKHFFRIVRVHLLTPPVNTLIQYIALLSIQIKAPRETLRKPQAAHSSFLHPPYNWTRRL
jgi:hypothetical protein